MADYPTSVYWSKASSTTIRSGIHAEEMMNGAIHTQSFFKTGEVTFQVRHKDLDPTEANLVIGFLQANAGVEFTLTEPITGQQYTGRRVSDVTTRYSGDTFYGISWTFMGETV